MKLTIYENKKPVKTYTAEAYDLMFGTVEDIADAMNLDNLKTGSDVEIISLAVDLIKRNFRRDSRFCRGSIICAVCRNTGIDRFSACGKAGGGHEKCQKCCDLFFHKRVSLFFVLNAAVTQPSR